jgi:hypothetical protein
MRDVRMIAVALLCFVSPRLLLGQGIAAADVRATALLEKANALGLGTNHVADVVMVGTARRVAGSDDETGTVTLKGLATGETAADYSFPSGEHREARSGPGETAAGHWSGPDGNVHVIAHHNLRVEGAWFLPSLLLQRITTTQDKAFYYLGNVIPTAESLPVIWATDSRCTRAPSIAMTQRGR